MLSHKPDYINVSTLAEYLEQAFPSVCKAMGALPVAGHARLARIWARYDHNGLREMVQALQQIITVKVGGQRLYITVEP